MVYLCKMCFFSSSYFIWLVVGWLVVCSSEVSSETVWVVSFGMSCLLKLFDICGCINCKIQGHFVLIRDLSSCGGSRVETVDVVKCL